MLIAFKVGDHYRNRDGDYEVIALQGNTMKIRYADGRVIDSDVASQSRIYERMQEEEGDTSVEVKTKDAAVSSSESRNTDEIRDFVDEILGELRQPWGSNVIDRVFSNIESRRDRLSHYEKLVVDFGKPLVNSRVGIYVKQITGMENTGRTGIPKSGLISSYTILAPSKSK